MWDALSNVLTSGNGAAAMLLIGALVLVGVILVATGKLRVHTSHFVLGIEDRERLVLREQSKWLHTYCLSREAEIVRFAKAHGVGELPYGGYYAKYICERVYDLLMNWIMLNHVTKERAYVDLKKAEVWHLVCSLCEQLYQTDEFRKELDGWTEYVIENILIIRGLYGSKKREG